MRLIVLFFGALFFFMGCGKDQNQPQVFDVADNHLIVEGDNDAYLLNPIEDTHWYKGKYRSETGEQFLRGVKFDEGILDQIQSVNSDKHSVTVQYEFGKIKYTDFELIEGGITFRGIDEENGVHQNITWEEELLRFDSDISLANQVEEMYIITLGSSESTAGDIYATHKLTWSCAVGATIIAVGGAYAATLNHCNNIISTVANSCNACVEASFCSAQCVACPEQ